MIWNYHDDDVGGPAADIQIDLEGLPVETGRAGMTEYRVDHEHSNAYTVWQTMGMPARPTSGQYAMLEKAGRLELIGSDAKVEIVDGKARLKVTLPRQAVSLMEIEIK